MGRGRLAHARVVVAAAGLRPQAGGAAPIAPSRQAIEEFHAAALKAGGKDNGEPGPREGYAAYAAFAYDPDGNNVEAVIWEGEPAASERKRPAARANRNGRTKRKTRR